MAKTVLTNAYVSINSVVLSDHVNSVTLEWDNDTVDMTSMGDGGHTWLVGLFNCKLSVDFWQDYASSSVNATLSTIIQGGTAVPFKLGANGTAFSVSNPSFSGSIVPSTYQPLSGKVGDGNSTTVQFNVSGTITQGTS